MAGNNTYDAGSISVLEGLEAVRKRPGMYIGSVSTKGLNHLIYEIVDNSVDEHLAGFCTEIRVVLEKDGTATVTDNGRGIPVDMHQKGISAARLVFTTLHAGGKFDDSAYKTSGGLHGVGSSVVNALSTYMDVKISRDGAVYHDRYERGVPVIELENGLLPKIGKTKKTGTTINFLPDDTIFEKTKFRAEEVKSRLHETAYLNPELTIIFEDKRGDQTEHIEYHEPEGIIGFIRDLNKKKEALHEPVYFKGEADGIEVEAAFQYVNEFHENVLGFCNNIYNAEGGTHLTGFKTTFTTVMNQYAREIGILKEKDTNFTGADIRNGMTAIISIKHPDPRFEGQTKTKLDNPDAAKAVGKVAGDEIVLYFDRNLDVLKTVLSSAEKAAKIRKTEEKAKTNLLTKQKYSFDSNGKLANCESRDPKKCEIFIVEGDSAGGSAKTARNRNFQAILPIRGKILNVEKASIDKVLANAEIKTMINAFGCGFSEGYGNDFDITKLRYDKIIIMADADVERIDHLGNDNPFNSQNMLMSVISGNMEFDASGAISGSKNYYSPVELDGDPILSNVTTSAYGDQTCYTAGQSGDPTVDFHLTVATEDPIYIFFKTENQKSVNLWLGQWNDETSDYDFDWFNAYFEGDNYTIMRLGQFDIGTKLCLRMTVANEYTIVKNFFFYSFDEAMFQEDIDKMKENQWNITKFNDRKITGTITAEEGQVMMTSIPYEDGWTVKVDGKKVEPVKLLNALVGVPLEPGEHEVTMTFTPPGWNIGLICLAAGIVVLILFYRYDKKHNAVLLAIAREKRQAADGKQPEPAKAVSAKPTTSTKWESEKTETTSKNAEKKESKPPTEEKPKESEAEDATDKESDDSEQKTEDSDSKEEEATDSDSESK